MFSQLSSRFGTTQRAPFDFNVVDEAQDIGVAQLRFLAALGTERPDGLFFAGDLGQRIFQQPFSWQALGVEIWGRSRTLKINYRTSHQIRMRFDRLLGAELSDPDGNTEERSGTISVFNGPEPSIAVSDSADSESRVVAAWLTDLVGRGVEPQEISVFVRSTDQVSRAIGAIEAAGLQFTVLDNQVQTTEGNASVSTMHLAKGLEFRAVVVMACDDEVIPLQERIESVTDDSDLEDVYNTERHLLYVACTRARLPPRNRRRASVRVPGRPSRLGERKPMTAAKPIHPGEHLAETLQELGITQYRLAKTIGVPQIRIHDIVHCRRSITADTALRIGQALGMTPDYWLNLQRMYDLDVARTKTDVSAIEPAC